MIKVRLIVEFLKDWGWLAVPLAMIPVELVARVIKTKNRASPLYWIKRILTILVDILDRRFPDRLKS